MHTGKVKIVSLGTEGRPVTGRELRVSVVGPDGVELLLPAQSLVLKVGSRHEQVVATIEVPAIVVDITLDQSQLATVADVQPGGPESQWEATLGKQPGDRIADVEVYAEPHRDLIAPPAAVPILPGPPLKVDEARFTGEPPPRATPSPEHVEDVAAQLRATLAMPGVDIDAMRDLASEEHDALRFEVGGPETA